MDNEATVMRQQMAKTLAGLNDKFGELEHQVSGTVRTVKDSVNTVRDTFDPKLQVRRRPWTFLAGATALGFLLGSRSSNYRAGHPARNGRNESASRARVAAHKPNDGTNGADAARLSAATAPSWLAGLGNTFKPEITALRGVAVGMLVELVREIITKQAPKPMAQSVGDANNVSNGKLEGQRRTSR